MRRVLICAAVVAAHLGGAAPACERRWRRPRPRPRPARSRASSSSSSRARRCCASRRSRSRPADRSRRRRSASASASPSTRGRGLSDRSHVVIGRGLSSKQLAARIAAESDVEYAVADERKHIVAVPNDPLYAPGPQSTADQRRAGRRPVVPEAAPPAGPRRAGADRARRRSTPSRRGTSRPAARASSSPCSTPASASTIPTCKAATSCRATTWSAPTRRGVVHERQRRQRPRRRRLRPGRLRHRRRGRHARAATDDRPARWHGTQTLGLIGAATNNGVGMASVGRGRARHAGARARQVRRLRLRHPGRHALGRRHPRARACPTTRRRRASST